jgi:hypothetical protein
MSTCRSCQAPVQWLENVTTGKRAPIDAEPVIDGNVEIDEAAGTYRVVTGREQDQAVAERRPLHLNHFCDVPAVHRLEGSEASRMSGFHDPALPQVGAGRRLAGLGTAPQQFLAVLQRIGSGRAQQRLDAYLAAARDLGASERDARLVLAAVEHTITVAQPAGRLDPLTLAGEVLAAHHQLEGRR